MDFFEKLGETIAERGKEAADKAREAAEIARLKSRISTCEEVIKKNYMEIGRLYYEKYAGQARPEPAEESQMFEKQCRSITNARRGVEELQQQIREIKGL